MTDLRTLPSGIILRADLIACVTNGERIKVYFVGDNSPLIVERRDDIAAMRAWGRSLPALAPSEPTE